MERGPDPLVSVSFGLPGAGSVHETDPDDKINQNYGKFT